MAGDDLKNITIEIDNECSLLEWCSLLNCEEKDLLDAIFSVGNSANAVDAYLTMNRKKKDC